MKFQMVYAKNEIVITKNQEQCGLNKQYFPVCPTKAYMQIVNYLVGSKGYTLAIGTIRQHSLSWRLLQPDFNANSSFPILTCLPSQQTLAYSYQIHKHWFYHMHPFCTYEFSTKLYTMQKNNQNNLLASHTANLNFNMKTTLYVVHARPEISEIRRVAGPRIAWGMFLYCILIIIVILVQAGSFRPPKEPHAVLLQESSPPPRVRY